MIYFDNAATGGYKPSQVIDAVNSTIRYVNANAGRSGHRLAVNAGLKVLHARQYLSKVFNNGAPERVVFTKNCTEALNTAIFGMYEKGSHVITTVTEHNSVLRPLSFLFDEGLIDLSIAPLKPDNSLDEDALISLISPKTKLIVVNMVSNVTGVDADIKKITAAAKPLNIKVIADAAQAAGHTQIDMQDLQIDALAVAGHKGMCGIQGSSCLIFNKACDIRPLTMGGTGSESIRLKQPSVYPERLESGTLNYPSIASLYEGAIYIDKNLSSFSRALVALTEELYKGIKRIGKAELFSTPNRYGILSFRSFRQTSEEVAYILSEKYDIACRGGLHCAPLMHKALGTDGCGLLRVSLSPHNKSSEIATFLNALNDILL